MIYSSDQITISFLQTTDALQLNKLFVSNTQRFLVYLPTTLSQNSTFEGSQTYINRKIESAEKREEFVFVIHDQHSSNIVGLVILKELDWASKQGEFAYCIGSRFKGKGVMRIAIQAISKYATQTMGLNKLLIITHKNNIASVNVALGSGFVWKETLKDEFTPINEAPQDMELYENLRMN